MNPCTVLVTPQMFHVHKLQSYSFYIALKIYIFSLLIIHGYSDKITIFIICHSSCSLPSVEQTKS